MADVNSIVGAVMQDMPAHTWNDMKRVRSGVHPRNDPGCGDGYKLPDVFDATTRVYQAETLVEFLAASLDTVFALYEHREGITPEDLTEMLCSISTFVDYVQKHTSKGG